MQDKIVILTIGPLLSQCSTVSDLRQFIVDVHSCGLTVPAPKACTQKGRVVRQTLNKPKAREVVHSMLHHHIKFRYKSLIC